MNKLLLKDLLLHHNLKDSTNESRFEADLLSLYYFLNLKYNNLLRGTQKNLTLNPNSLSLILDVHFLRLFNNYKTSSAFLEGEDKQKFKNSFIYSFYVKLTNRIFNYKISKHLEPLSCFPDYLIDFLQNDDSNYLNILNFEDKDIDDKENILNSFI